MASGTIGAEQEQGGQLLPEAWETLVDAVVAPRCTPFLGAGVAVPYLPRGGALAAGLARDFDYPLDDVTNLARVTQYIASNHEPFYVKRRVRERIERAQRAAGETLRGGVPQTHLQLASLGLPIYITTNYDDYLERALRAQGAEPIVEICRWNNYLSEELGEYAKDKPAPRTPLVFHLHGHISDENSILVTEDDYIDFTVSLAQRRENDPVIPHLVRRALGNTNLLFVGYSLEDWNFRVLLRHIMRQEQIQPHERSRSLSIQLSDEGMAPDRRRRAERFLEKYLQTSSAIDVYWGDAGRFLGELTARVAAARDGRAP